MKIRIKFAKQGNMRFIGHLDIMRYFQKAMRRADVDIKYSEGFSPHQVMSFASPLGVGLTSNGEYMDIEVNNTDSSEIMVKRLNDAMVEGMTVLSYRRLDEGAGNAMSIVAEADYTLTIEEDSCPEELAVRCCELMQKEIVIVSKKGKKGMQDVDIRPMIKSLDCEANIVHMRLSSGSAANLKPELVMDALSIQLSHNNYQIQREDVYAEVNGIMVSLEELGDIIE